MLAAIVSIGQAVRMSNAARSVRSHPWLVAVALGVVAVVAVGVANRSVVRAWFAEDIPVDFTLPVASSLDPADGESIYVIDASKSRVLVAVDEVLAGNDKRVELTTKSIAGQVGLGESEAGTTARIGEVVVGVDQLRSDNSLRDKILQHEFLESHTNKVVRLVSADVSLPDSGASSSVEGATVEGTIELKGVEYPTTWSVDAELDGSVLTVEASTTVLMSELGVGPITKAGLVTTSDEVDIRVEVVAERGHVPPTGLVDQKVEAVAVDASTAPSFAEVIQPILESNCASCHAAGEIGGSMWTLEVAKHAAEVADGLVEVTRSGYMPPWPASDLGVEMLHPRGLDQDDIDAIAAWAEAGAPLDVEPMTPIEVPVETDVPRHRADKVVRMAEPYKGTPEEVDDYRCFVLDPEVTEPTFLTGYTFDPDQLGTVHHAIVTRVRADKVAETRSKDDADEGPGWGCLAGMGLGLGDRIAGWVPGQSPVKFKEGDGFELLPGDVLVAQIHYHYNPGVPADQSGMTLELTPGDHLTPIESRTLIGPVELPCSPGMVGPLCERDAAMVDIGERFGAGAKVIADGLHFVCGSTVEQQASTFDGRRGSTTCDFSVKRPGDAVGILAHMHEIGSSYRLTHNPGTPQERILLDIPVWNFGWQLGYQPVEEIKLERGEKLRVTCTWDRTLRHEKVPRYIVFAEGTEDEMCYTALTVRPR